MWVCEQIAPPPLPPGQGSRLLPRKPELSAQPLTVTHRGSTSRQGEHISVFYLVKKSKSFQWSTSRQFPFFTTNYRGMGRKGNGGRERSFYF